MDGTLNNSTLAEPVFSCEQQKRWCQESFRSGIYTAAIAVIFVNVLTALTAVLGNALIFVAYYQNESLRKPANTILLSLAVTDFLTGAVSQPLFIYEKILILTNCTARICLVAKLKNFVMILLVGGTLLNLSLSTLDRYVAVLHSFSYPELVTDSRVKKVLLTLWLALISVAIVGTHFSLVSVSVAMIFPSNIIFISILYYKIFKEIRRLKADPVVAANETEETRRAKERKSAETVGIIVGLLFFCYIPVITYLLVWTTQKFVLQVQMNANNIVLLNQKLVYAALTFAATNSSLNVLVYYWKNTEIRSAMLKVVRPIIQRFRNEVNP